MVGYSETFVNVLFCLPRIANVRYPAVFVLCWFGVLCFILHSSCCSRGIHGETACFDVLIGWYVLAAAVGAAAARAASAAVVG